MFIYSIKNSPAESQYHGCGKAWAAIKKDSVVAIKYMSDFRFNPGELPGWVIAVLREYPGLSDICFHVHKLSSVRLAKIKNAAISAGHPEFGPRGGHIKATAIARAAQELMAQSERNQFGIYRAECRAELAELGDVASGMCSCFEFVASH